MMPPLSSALKTRNLTPSVKIIIKCQIFTFLQLWTGWSKSNRKSTQRLRHQERFLMLTHGQLSYCHVESLLLASILLFERRHTRQWAGMRRGNWWRWASSTTRSSPKKSTGMTIPLFPCWSCTGSIQGILPMCEYQIRNADLLLNNFLFCFRKSSFPRLE